MRLSGVTYVPRKSHKTRNTIIIAVSFAFLIIAAIMLISIYDAWQLTHPKKVTTPPITSNIGIDYKDISFNDINKNFTLRGWYFEAKNSTKTVIFAHGHSKNKLLFGNKTFDLIKDFYGKGYNVLTFDFSGSGSSSGNLSTFGYSEKSDMLGAISYAKFQGAKTIVLFGVHTGASACIMAAADPIVKPGTISALILDSSYSDLNKYLNELLPTWSGLPSIPFNKTILTSMRFFMGVNPEKVLPEKEITKLSPTPILFIHSKDETNVPLSHSAELYGIYRDTSGVEKTELWETIGASGCNSYLKYPEMYSQKVFDFLDSISVKK